MTSQEVVDKLTEIRYEANCTLVSPARLVANLVDVMLAQQEQITALEQQVDALKAATKAGKTTLDPFITLKTAWE